MEPSSELKDFMLRIYQAMTQGDISFIEQHVARQKGLVAIGTDPKEWWGDSASFITVLKAQMQEMGGGFPIVPGEVTAYREGTVGWAADYPKFRMPDGSEMPFRITAVLHQENGQWKVVQWHASIGISNEAAFGQELTT